MGEYIFKDILRNILNPAGVNIKTDSPIEKIFIDRIAPKMHPEVQATSQYEVNVAGMNFRLDFVFEFDGEKIGIECDGKDFHYYHRDLWRDALILGNDKLDCIYRFTGKDIYPRMNEITYLIYYLNRKFFPPYAHYDLIHTVNETFYRQQSMFTNEDMKIYYGHGTMECSRRTKFTRKTAEIFRNIKGIEAKSIEELTQKVKQKLNLK